MAAIGEVVRRVTLQVNRKETARAVLAMDTERTATERVVAVRAEPVSMVTARVVVMVVESRVVVEWVVTRLGVAMGWQ